MIKRGISGIVLCFFCCVNCFPVYVFAQGGENQQTTEVNEVVKNSNESDEEIENQTIIEDESQETESESTGSFVQEEESHIENETQNVSQDSGSEESQDTSTIISQGENIEENSGENQTVTGSENTGSGEIQEENTLIPGIFIDFQNPSYILEKDTQKENYVCDSEKSECKLNLKIQDENQQDFSSAFGCEASFSTGEFFDNCNPTSVVMTEIENDIGIKVFEINNPDNFIEKNITISNASNQTVETPEEESEENSGENQTGTGSENTGNGEVQEENILIPGIFIDFQNPSYILEKDIQKDDYICDPEKSECKLNLKILDENQQDFSGDFGCEINYGTGEILETCNPTTITLLESENNIGIKVFEENNPDNFIEKSITISNDSNQTVENPDQEELENQEDSGEIISEDDSVQEENIEENSGENQTGTGSENTGSGEVQEENILISGIFIDFQNPSYILEKDIQKDDYICDSDKSECKLNLKILDENQQDFSSDFGCEINYGTGEILETCNPTTFTLLESENNIGIKVFEINNSENFIEKNVFISNTSNQTIETPEQEEAENQEDSGEIIPQEVSIEEQNSEPQPESGSGVATETHSDENSDLENFTFPDIDLEIQSGGNITGDSIYCNKNDCSLNLNLENIFGDNFDQGDYLCEWNFGNGTFSTQNTHKKCNPGYVKYNIGTDEISIKLIQKDNVSNYVTKNYTLNNPKVIKAKSSSGNSSSQNNSSDEDIQVDVTVDKDIIVQSGAENFICEESLCSINLQYANTSYESCVWDFLGYQEDEKYTHSCNPRNIYLPAGIHKITLKVYNKKSNKYHDKFISIYNKFEEKKIELENEVFELILQGKETQYRKHIGNKIICLGVEKCNINLATKGNNKYTYDWNFGNSMTSDKMNPSGIWFDIGSYGATLIVTDSDNIIYTLNFEIEVIGPENNTEIIKIAEKIEEYESVENNYFSKIGEINLLDNIGKLHSFHSEKKVSSAQSKKIETSNNKFSITHYFDENQKINNKLKLTRNISQQKKAIKYSGKTFPNSEIFIDNGLDILKIYSDETGAYELKEIDDLRAGNFLLDYYVIDENGKYFSSNSIKNIDFSHNYIAELQNNINEISNKNTVKVSSKTSKNKIDNDIIIQEKYDQDNVEYASIIPNMNTQPTTLLQKYLWVFIFLFLGFGIFLIGKRYKVL